MSRKPITQATIKQLFALSGNRCAFPDCVENIVDNGRNIIGQICHIEAAEKGGERYNDSQTDDERASFDNLILLCAKHHIVTNDVDKYTVEILQKMKKDHESLHKQNQYIVQQDLVEKAQTIVNAQQNNSNIGNGNLIATNTGNIIVQNTGLSLADATHLFSVLFEQNYPRLRLEAHQEARRRVEELKKEFDRVAAAANLNAEQVNRFSDPEVQDTLNAAVHASTKKDDHLLRNHLANLIVDKLKANAESLSSIIFTEAIETISKLSLNQLNIISFIFGVGWLRLASRPNWSQIYALFHKFIYPFTNVNVSIIDLHHIEYCGCGTFGIGRILLDSALIEAYPWLAVRGFSEEDLKTMSPPASQAVKSFASSEAGRYRFLVKDAAELQHFLTAKTIQDSYVQEIVLLQESGRMTQLMPDNPSQEFKKIVEVWNSTLMQNMHLTSVGIAIAITHISHVAGEKMDPNLWLQPSSPPPRPR